MNRIPVLVLGAWMVVGCQSLVAQAVPDDAQALDVPPGYRRPSLLRVDPFRYTLIPRWGFVFSALGTGENNTVDLTDLGSLIFLSERDSLLIGDVVDAFGLVPRGAGVRGTTEGSGGLYVGGPFGGRVSIGLSATGRGYGAFKLDDAAVALLRDGNGSRTDFPVGDTEGAVLATGEVGAHAAVRFGVGLGTELTVGFGGRYIRPLYYARAQTTIDSRAVVTGDSIGANVTIEKFDTPEVQADLGSGVAFDVLVRAEWPRSGLAVEAMVANLGQVSIEGVRRELLRFNVQTTSLNEVSDSLETTEFVTQDTGDVDVTIPRIIRFSASAWANRILQLDVSATLPSVDEFGTPVVVDLGSTWRVVRSFPMRVGLVLGGHQNIGYTAGFGVESRNILFRLDAASLGGLFRDARGVAGRFELGFFF